MSDRCFVDGVSKKLAVLLVTGHGDDERKVNVHVERLEREGCIKKEELFADHQYLLCQGVVTLHCSLLGFFLKWSFHSFLLYLH